MDENTLWESQKEKRKLQQDLKKLWQKIPQIWGKVGIYKFKQLTELPSTLNPKEPTDHTETL